MGIRAAGPVTVPVPGTGPGVLLMANSSVAPFLLFVNRKRIRGRTSRRTAPRVGVVARTGQEAGA